MQRNGENEDAVLLEHAAQFAEHAGVVLGVLDDVARADEIEFPIGERQRIDAAGDGDAAARIQPLDGRRADVDEMGARNREARPEARSDLES